MTVGRLGPANGGSANAHVPVLLAEVLTNLAIPAAPALIVDGTFGAGGYTRAVLETTSGRVLAIDRDPTAVAAGQGLARAFPGRLELVEGRFSDLDRIAAAAGHPHVDGVMLDIGVSSMQLDQAERGFSFQDDGPLDMRMSRTGLSAADIVNRADEAVLADILHHYGEEKRARAIARAIVERRRTAPFTRTIHLADLVARVLKTPRIDGRHAATRTFQALRIAVNDELSELARGLAAAERVLRPGGRLAVVTFHSLEDRIVKRFLHARAGREPSRSRHLPPVVSAVAPSFRILNHRPLTPSQEEIEANPRARSAKLRAAERTSAPAHDDALELGLPRISLAV